ncbi:MAG: AroM family protein [Pseudomonadota bacterium]
MGQARIGVVVIGQSPRPDIVAELRRVLGEQVAIELAGALDGLSRAEIDRLAPDGSHDTLYTNLPDGSGAIIAKREVARRAQAKLDRFAESGIDVVLINCTGAFAGLVPRGHVVFPSAVLRALVAGLLPDGRLGVFTPLAEQEIQVRDKWEQGGWHIDVVPLLPRTAGAELDTAARELARRRPDLIVMDCMGYTQAMKERVRAVAGIRAVLAISAAARAVHELIA